MSSCWRRRLVSAMSGDGSGGECPNAHSPPPPPRPCSEPRAAERPPHRAEKAPGAPGVLERGGGAAAGGGHPPRRPPSRCGAHPEPSPAGHRQPARRQGHRDERVAHAHAAPAGGGGAGVRRAAHRACGACDGHGPRVRPRTVRGRHRVRRRRHLPGAVRKGRNWLATTTRIGGTCVQEFCAGMCSRPDWSDLLRRTPIATVKLGTNNAVAQGLRTVEPEFAALCIVKRYLRPLDAMVVSNAAGIRTISLCVAGEAGARSCKGARRGMYTPRPRARRRRLGHGVCGGAGERVHAPDLWRLPVQLPQGPPRAADGHG